jgi:hypothetical protein
MVDWCRRLYHTSSIKTPNERHVSTAAPVTIPIFKSLVLADSTGVVVTLTLVGVAVVIVRSEDRVEGGWSCVYVEDGDGSTPGNSLIGLEG